MVVANVSNVVEQMDVISEAFTANLERETFFLVYETIIPFTDNSND